VLLAEIGNGFSWGLLLGLIGGLVAGAFEGMRILERAAGRAGLVEAVMYALVIDALGFGAVLALLGAATSFGLRVFRVNLGRPALAALYVSAGFALCFVLGRLIWLFPARKMGEGAGSRLDVALSVAAAVVAGLVLFPVARLFAWRLLNHSRRVAAFGLALAVCLGLALPLQVLLEARSYMNLTRGSAAAVNLGVLETDRTATLESRLDDILARGNAGGSAPNILLITVDALRADHIAECGQNDWIQTPSMDILARHGALSCTTYTEQPQTNPAFASVFTSTYPQVHGVRVHMVDRLSDSFDTLAESLRARGYSTGAILPWTALDPAFSGFHQGFQVYEAFVLNAPETLQNPITTSLGALYRRITDQVALGSAVETVLGVREQVEEDIDGRADVTAAAAINWLNLNGKRSPFFLWVHFFDPHYPWTPPEPWNELYTDPDYEGTYDGSMGFVYEMREGVFNPDDRDVEHLRELYAAEVTYADHYIGQVLGQAADLGLLQNTIVVLTGDHGESLGERPGPWPEGDDWLHGDDLYSPGIEVPLVIFDPRHPTPGQRLTAPLQHIDVMPTLLEMIGAPIPAGAQGRSIVPLLQGNEDGPPRTVFTTLADDRASSMVTAEGWKLIMNWRTGGRELYFLPTDPRESANLADLVPTRTAAMAAELESWIHGGTQQAVAPGEREARADDSAILSPP
jgi:arylsulfatase A-like enzyme